MRTWVLIIAVIACNETKPAPQVEAHSPITQTKPAQVETHAPITPTTTTTAPRVAAAPAKPLRAADVTPSAKTWPAEAVVGAAIVILDGVAAMTEYHRADCEQMRARVEDVFGSTLAQREIVATVARSASLQAHLRRELARPDSKLAKAYERAVAPARASCADMVGRISEGVGLPVVER